MPRDKKTQRLSSDRRYAKGKKTHGVEVIILQILRYVS